MIKKDIKKLITSLGVPKQYKGNLYLEYALNLYVKDPKHINEDNIYQILAQYFGVSEVSVCSCLLRLIEHFWFIGGIQNQYKIIGCSIEEQVCPPDFSVFISGLLNQLKQDGISRSSALHIQSEKDKTAADR